MGGVDRGVLYPARLPTFTRLPAPEPVASLVRWFWIPEWQIQPGRSSRQHLIAFPACNLVVEPDAVGLAGGRSPRRGREPGPGEPLHQLWPALLGARHEDAAPGDVRRERGRQGIATRLGRDEVVLDGDGAGARRAGSLPRSSARFSTEAVLGVMT